MKHVYLIMITGVLSACAQTGTSPYYGQQQSSYPPTYSQPAYQPAYGVVERIEVVRKGDTGVAGTVIGGIVGGLIGHQLGSGRGQTAATVIGAAGGAVAGHEVERRRNANETFRVTVRLNNGSYQTVTQDDITDLRTGDRVRVDGGRVSRY